MATLHAQNVPEELFESLRARARSNRRSISAETVSLLEPVLPAAGGVRRRAGFNQTIQKLRSRKTVSTPGPPAEELLREDRQR
jgi:antitoxin FitA